MNVRVDGTLLALSLSGTFASLLAWIALAAFCLGVAVLADFLRAHGSGWTRVSKVYRARSRPRRGPTFFSYRSACSHRLSPLRSNLATLTEQGIYLETAYSRWRPFHPPLLLPWPFFRSLTVLGGKSSVLVELIFEDPAGGCLRVPLPAKALPALRRWSRRDDFSARALR